MEHPFLVFLDHTQRRSTVGRTPLEEWSARRRDLYLTTHDIHNRQISMPPVGFEPKISAGELITRPEESYRLYCVVVCDLETSRMGAPYVYDISHLRVKLLVRNSEGGGQVWKSRCIWQHTSKMYEALPKRSRNWNAARKPLVLRLCVARFGEFYPLWIILPSGILLWGRVCFFCAFLWRRISAVLRTYRPAKITEKKEQRICIKFCVKLGKTASETHRMLKEAVGDNALGQMQNYEWFKRLKKGRILVKD